MIKFQEHFVGTYEKITLPIRRNWIIEDNIWLVLGVIDKWEK